MLSAGGVQCRREELHALLPEVISQGSVRRAAVMSRAPTCRPPAVDGPLYC